MSDDVIVEITPPDLLRRMEKYPDKLREELESTTLKALYHVQGSVPEYPPADPDSSYIRTGTLGRTIGLGARPDIFEVKTMGARGFQGMFGTRLEYARYVIGTREQARIHKGRWWTMKTVRDKAEPGVKRLYSQMCARLADWLTKR